MYEKMSYIICHQETENFKTSYATHLLEWPKSKIRMPPDTGDVEQQEPPHNTGGNTKWYDHIEEILMVL